jgi:hypothetical protein
MAVTVLRTRWRLLSSFGLCVLGAGCAGSELGQVQAPAPALMAELQRLAGQAVTVEERIAAANRNDVEQCDLSAGECQFEVKDGRRNLVFGRSMLRCGSAQTAIERQRCEDDVIVEAGRAQPLRDWYASMVWCRKQTADCLDVRATAATKEATRVRNLRRDAQAAGAEAVVQASVELEVAIARVAYLLSLLPASANKQCTSAAPGEECQLRIDAARIQYEDYLNAGDSAFDPDEAAKRLAQTSSIESQCYGQQQACLEREAFEIGETDGTQALLKKVYDLLQLRQQQVSRLGTERAAECTEQSSPQVDVRLSALGVQYASKPNSALRKELHKIHIKRLQAQLRCLKAL